MSIPAALRALGCDESIVDVWQEPLAGAMQEFEIVGKLREAAFLANVLHESNNLRNLEENLNYSAIGLANTWASRYRETGGSPNELARLIAHHPTLIANHTYANRMGNGSVDSGDGWLYRGRGPIQLTGRSNYRSAGEALGLSLEFAPEVVVRPRIGALVSARFWKVNGCNSPADAGQFDTVCDIINIGRPTDRYGDAVGFPARLAAYETILMVYA